MNINYCPEQCPQCGTNFQEYYDAMKKDFEDKHVVELARVRSSARYRGIVKGLIKGLVLSTILFLSLSWHEPGTMGDWEHVWSFYSHHPYLVSMIYFFGAALFILIDRTANLREEQRMWEQFLQEQSQVGYLQPIS